MRCGQGGVGFRSVGPPCERDEWTRGLAFDEDWGSNGCAWISLGYLMSPADMGAEGS